MAPPNEEKIGEVSAELLRRWPGHLPGIITDRIDMEYVLESDPATRSQLAALRLTAAAQVYRVIADAQDKAAQIIGSQGS
jgi:hypothetical protein